MDSTTNDTFAATAKELGIRPKLLYSMQEVAQITGVAYNTLRDECDAGRLEYHLPEGRRNGRLFRPEWVDEWIERGTHAAASV